MNKIFFSEHLKRKFGRPMQRVPVDLPFSCPHRITGGGRGCVFCPEDGARARHLRANLDIPAQVRSGVEYVRRRYGADCGLIAYFQSFTNTNAPVDVLRKHYERALDSAEFAMVIIATRPDCLPEPVLDYLAELADRYELMVELGVQTANDATLAAINRGHDFQAVRDAAAKLAAHSIPSAAHVILGLPGETIRNFRETASKIAELPFSAVKIHNLLILKGTPLAASFAAAKAGKGTAGEQPLIMNEYEYADALLDFLHLIPDEWPLMRLTADAPPETVIAPKWWMSKGEFLEYLKKRMRGYRGPGASGDEPVMPEIVTADGSTTLYHPRYRQHFHSLSGARSEAFGKFVEPCRVRARLASKKHVRILDVGFGLGENAFAALETAELADAGFLEVISLEMDERPLKAALPLLRSKRECEFRGGSLDRAAVLEALLTKQSFESKRASLKVVFGDARSSLDAVEGSFDAVFLDPFSHEVNPELWTFDFVRKIAARLADGGVIATYSAAFPVRGAMLRSGLFVGETPAVGRRKGGTIASFDEAAVTAPIHDKTLEIIRRTTTGVPYRDPTFRSIPEEIRELRAKLVKRLAAKGVPKWLSRKKRGKAQNMA